LEISGLSFEWGRRWILHDSMKCLNSRTAWLCGKLDRMEFETVGNCDDDRHFLATLCVDP
jgi:hypothetical protein